MCNSCLNSNLLHLLCLLNSCLYWYTPWKDTFSMKLFPFAPTRKRVLPTQKSTIFAFTFHSSYHLKPYHIYGCRHTRSIFQSWHFQNSCFSLISIPKPCVIMPPCIRHLSIYLPNTGHIGNKWRIYFQRHFFLPCDLLRKCDKCKCSMDKASIFQTISLYH